MALSADGAPGDEGEVRGVKSAHRTVDLLEELAGASGPRSLGELARALSIPKSSLHGLLRTLERRQWVETDDTGLRFRLGVRALRLASSHLAQDRDVQILHDAMRQLCDSTGETVQLARLVGNEVVYLAQFQGRHPVRLVSAVGERLPAHATALGKALLAARTDEELQGMLELPLAALTVNTLSDWPRLQAALAAIREVGVAWDEEEASVGLTCVAAAVPSAGLPTHAVSISIPTFRLSEELRQDLVRMLTAVADSLRERLWATSAGL